MSLDLENVSSQLDAIVSGIRIQSAGHKTRLEEAIKAIKSSDGSAINKKRVEGKFSWPTPLYSAHPERTYPPLEAPENYCVLATDGSHIDVDRHLPLQCSLINISKVSLQYGNQPQAHLGSQPRLYTKDHGIKETKSPGVRAMSLEGSLLSAKRSVDEIIALAELAEEGPQQLPVLALVDGSLELWGPTIQASPEYIREALINQGLISSFARLREIARRQPLALAAYISLPRSTGVADGLRLTSCPYDPVNCELHCSGIVDGDRPCDTVGGILDRELFSTILPPGERSELFYSTSSIVQEYYGPHAVAFYYLNTGDELARVEVPNWVAQDQNLLALSHTLILDQCKKGLGYPAAIMEAHEQAVINVQDREMFRRMVEDTLANEGLPVYTSEKDRSKRLRWL
jgi:hypothetical protein